ncbi:hypothetical protein H1C71_003767, partial [Ictidomys tridecemlineatus]
PAGRSALGSRGLSWRRPPPFWPGVLLLSLFFSPRLSSPSSFPYASPPPAFRLFREPSPVAWLRRAAERGPQVPVELRSPASNSLHHPTCSFLHCSFLSSLK